MDLVNKYGDSRLQFTRNNKIFIDKSLIYTIIIQIELPMRATRDVILNS